MIELLLTSLITIFNDNTPKADLLIKRFLQHKNLSKANRNAVYDAFYYYLRHKNQVLFLSPAPTAEAWATTALALSINQLTEEQNKKWATLSTSEQQNLLNSVPPFWQVKLVKAYGPHAAVEVGAFLNERATITLLTLLKRTTRVALLAQLEELHKTVLPTLIAPTGIYLEEGSVPTKDAALFFDLQDEGSQLMALLFNSAHQSCLDFCTGQGGKTISFGSLWPKTKFYCSDIRDFLAEKVLARTQHAGISAKWLSKNKLAGKTFATVILDAPCSGSGVWRRNPDDKHRFDDYHFKNLLATQQKLLREAGKLVSLGGELLYITCSFTQEENEEALAIFLKNVASFTLIDAPKRLKLNLAGFSQTSIDLADHFYDGPFLRLKPHQNRDLLFAAILQKIK